MTYLLVAIVAVTVLGWAFWFFGRKPVRHVVPLENLERYIQEPLRRQAESGWIRIERERSPEFIQFSTYRGNRGPGLELSFPRTSWSESCYLEIARIASEQGLKAERQPVEGGDVREFLVVDFGTDVKGAADFSRLVFSSVFRLAQDEKVVIVFHW